MAKPDVSMKGGDSGEVFSARDEMKLDGSAVPDRAVRERSSFAPASLSQQPFLRQERRSISPEEVTVLIPTLDEALAIGKVLDDLKKEGYDNILVVDGHSTDGTVEIARNKGAIVVTQHGAGKAGALRTAIEMVNTPYMLVMDGDDTYRASDIKGLLAYGGSYDEVIGARTEGRDNIPRVNRFGNWVISSAFKLLFGDAVTDVLSGMYLLNTEKLRSTKLTSASFDIEVEIASAMTTEGTITQVPISYGKRLGEQKLRLSHGGRILSTLFWMAYYYNPVFLFGGLVALATIPATGILLWVFFEGLFFGVWHSIYAIMGVALFLLGTQAASIALVSLLLKRSETRMINRLSRIRE
jgi:dolichol-phosphate hexosyltransferase